MENRELDSLIQETLEQYASQISMSSDLQKQIKQKIRSKSEEKSMIRHYSKRKVILAAAALCLIGSMAAVAAGRVSGWSSSTDSSKPDFVSMKDLPKAEARMGFSIQAVEEFSNGYQFEQGFIIDVKELDDNMQKIGTFPETKLHYGKGSDRVGLYVYPQYKVSETSKHKEIAEIPYGEMLLTFTKDIYKFVPPGYEVTPEEEALIETGELYVSYGSKTVEIMEMLSVSWRDGDAYYLLQPFGEIVMQQDELVQMAQEVIDAGK